MRILVVEDEQRIANTLKKGLELERFAVDVAYTGDRGYDLAAGEDYDLLILDLLLPGLDGLNICRKLRAKNIRTPILMLTAKGQIEDKVAGLNSGADDYLTKPFSFVELLARVRALTRRHADVKDVSLQIGDLTLNPVSFVVRRKNQNISLTGKEFALLEYFMRHSGRILTKAQIIAHVWDYDADILPNTVEVYVKNLRKKIDLPFPGSPPLIDTLRGFGYKIGS